MIGCLSANCGGTFFLLSNWTELLVAFMGLLSLNIVELL